MLATGIDVFVLIYVAIGLFEKPLPQLSGFSLPIPRIASAARRGRKPSKSHGWKRPWLFHFPPTCNVWYNVLMSDDLNKSQFIATIPPIMTGIKTGGDGMRVQFDIPETDIGEAAKLLAMRGKLLRVTVETITDGTKRNRNSTI